MCNQCFDNEIERFDSQNEFDSFVDNLKKKECVILINSISDKFGEPAFTIFGIAFGGKFERGYDLYRCSKCGQLWKLSEPSDAWRGYFRKADG